MTTQDETIAILGGTGDQGLGLALRFCRSGRRVLIGSRKAERAVEAAVQVRSQVPGAQVEGFSNEEATAGNFDLPWEHGQAWAVGELARRQAAEMPMRTVAAAKANSCA